MNLRVNLTNGRGAGFRRGGAPITAQTLLAEMLLGVDAALSAKVTASANPSLSAGELATIKAAMALANPAAARAMLNAIEPPEPEAEVPPVRPTTIVSPADIANPAPTFAGRPRRRT